MTEAFADASACVKRYVDEPGADLVLRLSALALASLTRVELPSAIWRKQRSGALSLEQTNIILDAFDGDWLGTPGRPPAYAVIDIDGDLLDRAAKLVGPHALRAGDAIQLACAVAAREADPEIVSFACFDGRLREAAAREGFRLLPAELPA